MDEVSELEALRALAWAGAGALRSGGHWETLLRRVERTADFGLANTLLIWAQQPDAVLLRDYHGWQKARRQVRRGEYGVRVIVRHRDRSQSPDGEVRVRTVFDLTQTDGNPVPVRIAPRRGFPIDGAAEAVVALGLRAGGALPVLSAAVADGDLEPLLAQIRQVAQILCRTRFGDGMFGGPLVKAVTADSVAFLIATRLGLDTCAFTFPSVSSWAGVDERARRTERIMASGDLIVSTAVKAFRCLDANTQRAVALRTGPRLARMDRAPVRVRACDEPAVAAVGEELTQVTAVAPRFYAERLDGSWVPGYLAQRGFGAAILERWQVGYAPAAQAALVTRLREIGHGEHEIEASGLGKRSANGDLVDVFRNRAMFPVRRPDGSVAGFIGRASEDAGSAVPKYLNSRQTSVYQKGKILFGIHEARASWADGVVPVIVEGPLDAIAVTVAGEGKYAAVAPCGTALTAAQVELLRQEAGLKDQEVMVAFDGDDAGRRAAVRAYDLLVEHARELRSAKFPNGQDPASMLRDSGAAVLVKVLDGAPPLADVVVDGTIAKFDHWLEFIEGKFNALHAVAPVIARLPENQVARQVRRVAEQLGLTHCEVTRALIDAATQDAAPSADQGEPDLDGRLTSRRSAKQAAPARSCTHRVG